MVGAQGHHVKYTSGFCTKSRQLKADAAKMAGGGGCFCPALAGV